MEVRRKYIWAIHSFHIRLCIDTSFCINQSQSKWVDLGLAPSLVYWVECFHFNTLQWCMLSIIPKLPFWLGLRGCWERSWDPCLHLLIFKEYSYYYFINIFYSYPVAMLFLHIVFNWGIHSQHSSLHFLCFYILHNYLPEWTS